MGGREAGPKKAAVEGKAETARNKTRAERATLAREEESTKKRPSRVRVTAGIAYK